MSVDLGFETIGNATCTVFDNSIPVLTTDPWINGKPYFGSWNHRFEIPKNQKSNIYKSKYIWISHGHPDHLDLETLRDLKNAQILVPDHFNNRIYNDLTNLGYRLKKINSNADYKLSDNISIKCYSDYYQDSIILIKIKDKDLIVNINDSNLFGIKEIVKKEIKILKNYKYKFLLKAIGLHDADMVNFYDNENNFVLDKYLSTEFETGKEWASSLKELGCNMAIPFSSMHKYQRDDSIHINKYIKPLDNHQKSFENTHGELLPPFIIWNSSVKEYKEINPKEIKTTIVKSNVFNDNWNDILDKNDKKIITKYFNEFEILKSYIGIIHFNCGGEIFSVRLSNIKNEIIFEVPRHSLIKAIRYSIFDDLLIGNFMKTRLLNLDSLYPKFAPFVTKFYDNGRVKNFDELKDYYKYYKKNSGSSYLFFKDQTKRKLKKNYKGSILELFYYYSTRVYYHIFQK
tara:strand:+ start:4018 stop:5391 length:1374 start_codon:yes stop_codon:yes gene_type:complete